MDNNLDLKKKMERLMNTSCDQCSHNDMSWAENHDHYLTISVCEKCGGVRIEPTTMSVNKVVWLEMQDKTGVDAFRFYINSFASTSFVVGVFGDDETYLEKLFTHNGNVVFMLNRYLTDEDILRGYLPTNNVPTTSLAFKQYPGANTDLPVDTQSPASTIEHPKMLAMRLIQGWVVFTLSGVSLIVEYLYIPTEEALLRKFNKIFRTRSRDDKTSIVTPVLTSINADDIKKMSESPSLSQLKMMFGGTLIRYMQ